MQEARYRLVFQGMTPLVMNSNAALLNGEDKGRNPAQYEREHFLDKTYRAPDGQLCIPARAVKKTLINACKFIPEKPKGVSFKSFGPFIEAALIVDADAVIDVAISKVVPWTVVVNLDPSKGPKGPRGPRTRPLVPMPWNAETTVTVFDTILNADIVQRIAETAGKKVGFLDARTIDQGRCLVTVEAA